MTSVSDKTFHADPPPPSIQNAEIGYYLSQKASLEIVDFREAWLFKRAKLEKNVVIKNQMSPQQRKSNANVNTYTIRNPLRSAINKLNACPAKQCISHDRRKNVRKRGPAREAGGQNSTAAYAPKYTVAELHASNLLGNQQHCGKMRVLRAIQNDIKINDNCLSQHKKGNGARRSLPKNYPTNSTDCAKESSLMHNLHTDSEEEQYVGYPFYIEGDDGTQQSKDICFSASETTSSTAEEEEKCENYFTPKCVLSPSLFPNVAPYLNFASHAKKGPPMPARLHRVLKWKASTAMPQIVRFVVLNTGFRIMKTETDWTGAWEHHMRNKGFRDLRCHQKFNHMPGSYRIGRKDTLWGSISKNVKKFGTKEFSFMQQTYIMPADMQELRQAWPKHAATLTKWIVKPPACSRGIGIRVVSKWAQFSKDRPLIVQKYIERPLLINDSKFDLRLYVVLTSIDPLKIYLYKEGLVRFATKKYSTSINSLNERCMHLTNYSINKYSESYLKNLDFNTCQGHKWTLQSLWCCLEERGVNTKNLWATLRNLVIKSIICGESGMHRMYRRNVNFTNNCFELFGFDVLLDENTVPWLLEVNISPSLNSDMKLDRHVKGPLIQALLNTALYQVAPKLDGYQQSDIMREMNVDCANLCMDKRLFTTGLTPAEEEKHEIYTDDAIEFREQYLDGILEKLNPDDVRCLIIAEDELHRCAPLERVFPTAETHTYIKFMNKPRYYNRLLDAWETRYGNRRENGIALLGKFCEEGYHLQISDEA